jgi:hypothetical protein
VASRFKAFLGVPDERRGLFGGALHARRHFARDEALLFHRRGRRGDVLRHALDCLLDDFKRRRDGVEVFNLGADFVSRLLGLTGEVLYLGSDDRKTAACFAGASGSIVAFNASKWI